MKTFKSVAKEYFPDKSDKNASQTLSRWIVKCLPLREELIRLGYRQGQRYVTIPQCKCVYYHLGEP
ncbi:MAG: DUF4248 domain-containing protein [Bacteroidales bacterium]